MNEDEESHPEPCLTWAHLLPDAAEGLLGTAEREALDLHVLGCAGCAWELADAQRGAAWLAMLKGHAPEPPAGLLNAILEKTSGVAEASALAPVFPGQQTAVPSGFTALPGAGWRMAPRLGGSGRASGIWASLERWFGLESSFSSALQPRLAMTSAMAFFSICLTMNLLGVSVRSLNAQSLRPAGLQRTVSDKSASLVRSFEGIRLVYRVESRVNEWRTASLPQAEPSFGASR